MHRVADSVIGKRCPICLDRIEIRCAAVILPCVHAYCSVCIRRWSDFKRKCPLCNADFTSWLCKAEKGFCEETLLPIGKGKSVVPVRRDDVLLQRQRAPFFEQRRLLRRCKEASNVQSRLRMLPRQRSFGQGSHQTPDVINERIRQWRSSIYEKRLQAVPPHPSNRLMQSSVGNNGAKEMILRRIEPWIHRELQAVLGDPDPTVIVHVATSLFISRHERKHESFQGQIGVLEDFLAPLRPFLHERTDTFWHELRCFAESSLSMEAYDTVVKYRRVE